MPMAIVSLVLTATNYIHPNSTSTTNTIWTFDNPTFDVNISALATLNSCHSCLQSNPKFLTQLT
jgi:hypothetical protein